MSRQKIINDFGWVINDLGLSENCALSANDFNWESFEFYPNPAMDYIHLISEVDFLQIYDLNGKMMMETSLFQGYKP